jgi:hypothetical protein
MAGLVAAVDSVVEGGLAAEARAGGNSAVSVQSYRLQPPLIKILFLPGSPRYIRKMLNYLPDNDCNYPAISFLSGYDPMHRIGHNPLSETSEREKAE